MGKAPEDERREQEKNDEKIRGTLRYPFTESTMKERRNILTASLLGILVAYVGIVPESFPVFGIEFSANEQQNLLMLLLLIIIYFSISFYVRAFSDIAAMILVTRKGKTEYNATIVKVLATVFSVRLVIDIGVPLLTAFAALVGIGRALAA